MARQGPAERSTRRLLVARAMVVVVAITSSPLATATVVAAPLSDSLQVVRPTLDTSSAAVPYLAPTVGASGGITVEARPPIVAYKAPKDATELVEGRSERQRVTANPDGSISVEHSAGRINYVDPEGDFQPIDLTLVSVQDGPYALRVKANDRDVQIALSDPTAGMAKMSIGSRTVVLRAIKAGVGTKGIDSEKAVDRVTYAAMDHDPAPFVSPTTEGVEYGATWSDGLGSSYVEFGIDPGALSVRLASDKTSIEFVELVDETAGRKIEVIAGRIGAPTVLEGVDGKPSDALVVVTLSPVEGSGEVIVRYDLGTEWLNQPGRAFPVVLDPTFTICRAGCDDPNSFWVETYIGADNASTYPTSPSVLRVGYDAIGSPDAAWGTLRSLIIFTHTNDVAEIPDGAVITSATLRLRQTANYDGTTTPAPYARMISKSWGTTSTWNSMATAVRTGYDSPAVAPCLSHATNDCDVFFDVEKAVRASYSRRYQDWKGDYGFQIRNTTETTTLQEVDFYTNAGACTSTTCPKLTINYVVPHVGIDFDPALGANYSPGSMVAGQAVDVPLVVRNTGSGFTFDTTNYRAGYRWLDAKGKAVACPELPTTDCTTALPATVLDNNKSSPFRLSVKPPSATGQYSLRFDLVRRDGTLNLYASDMALPTKYGARSKKTPSPDDTRWVGTSVVERDEFGVNVHNGASGGDVQTVGTGSGGTIGINLYSKDVSYDEDTGLGFSDLIPLGLSYGYHEVDAVNCTGYLGILGACGWHTNFDERITGGPNQTGYDYLYTDQSGNRHGLDTDGSGQIASGAPALLNRPRFTYLDENEAPSASVNATSGEHYSGSFANGTPSGANAGLGFNYKVDLNTYPLVRFAMKTTVANSSGLCFTIHNVTNTDIADSWYCLTTGTPWTTGFDQSNLNGTIHGAWAAYTADLYGLVRNDGDFGSFTDDYQVVEVQIESAFIGGSGTTYLDALRLESDEIVYLDEFDPGTFTTGNADISEFTPIGSEEAPPSGSKVLKVTAGGTAPSCRNTGTACFTNLAMWGKGFASWSWKKVGGSTAVMTFYVEDLRSGAPCLSDCSVTYYAGPTPPPFASDAEIQVSPVAPADWTLVRRNLLEDARQVLSLFDDAHGGVPDDVRMTGYRISPVDGAYLLFDRFALGSLADTGALDPTGHAGQFGEPNTANDTAFVWDFTADNTDGSRHYFNRDGLLVKIRDVDGNTVDVKWNTGASATNGQSSYKLAEVDAPTNGTPDGGFTFARRFMVDTSTPPGDFRIVRFAEILGQGAVDDSSREASFYVATSIAGSGGNRTYAIGDLTRVALARDDDRACGDTTPNGCVEFSYHTSTSHILRFVADPRWDTSAPDANDYRWEIGRTGTDPTSIIDLSRTPDAPVLVVRTFDDTRDATKLYRRPAWQDGDALRASYLEMADLSPDGKTLRSYLPRACVPADCSNTGNWPAYASQVDYIASVSEFDGRAQLNTVRTYRCPRAANAVSGCPGTTALISVTRSKSNAGIAIDNYADPRAGSTTAWSQTADQYFASVRDSGGVDDQLYRTTFRYDGNRRQIGSMTSVWARTPTKLQDEIGTSPLIPTTNVKGYWKLDEASGATATATLGGVNGTYANVAYAGVGALYREAVNKAPTFNGTSSKVTAAVALPQSAYTIEAWVRPTAGKGGIAGRYSAANGGAMLYLINGSPSTIALAHTSTATNYLASSIAPSLNSWYHVVGSWDGAWLSLYVNGELAGRKAMTTAPGTGASAFEVGSYANGTNFLAGQIDEVAVYDKALPSSVVLAHYAAGRGVIFTESQTRFDRDGHPIQTTNNLAGNPGFEDAGLSGWYPDAGAPALSASGDAASGAAALKLPAGARVIQELQLPPGQTVHLQLASKTDSLATAKAELKQWDGSGWVSLDSISATHTAGYLTDAKDVILAAQGDGRLRLEVSNPGSANAYVDNVLLATNYTATTYAPNGLPTGSTTFKPGSATPLATTIAHDLPVGGVHPAIYVTSVIEDAGGINATTIKTLDAWGRILTEKDPDNIRTAKHEFGAPNQTDLTKTTDAFDRDTTLVYDDVGNLLSSTFAPASWTPQTTSAVFDLRNHVTEATGLDGTKAATTYDAAGRPSSEFSNYVNGSSDGTGIDDVQTDRTYDAFGNLVRTAIDTSYEGSIPAVSSSTYDALGNAVTTTTEVDGLLANPSVEKAVGGTVPLDWSLPTGWSLRTDASSTYVRSGQNSIQAVVPSPLATSSAISTKIPVTAGAVYDASVWATGYSTNGAGAWLEVYVRWYNQAGTQIGSDDLAGSQVTKGTDQTPSRVGGRVKSGGPSALAAPTGAVHAALVTKLGNTVVGNRIYVDDAALVELRATTSHFETTPAGTDTLSRTAASGMQTVDLTPGTGPLCPGSGSLRCDRAATWGTGMSPFVNDSSAVDQNGVAHATKDAYGNVSVIDGDLAGRSVLSIVNFTLGGGTGTDHDSNLTTTTQYDILGRPIRIVDSAKRVTRTTYDALGRAIETFRDLGALPSIAEYASTQTVYTKAGRVDRSSRTADKDDDSTLRHWTKTVYDLAGRARSTLANFDLGTGAQHQDTGFETGTAEGATTAAGGGIVGGATESLDTTDAKTGAFSYKIVTGTTPDQGASIALGGTFVNGRTYKAAIYAKGVTGQSWLAYFADASTGKYSESGTGTVTVNGAWQRIDVSWTPTSPHSSGVVLAFRANSGQAASNTVRIDAVTVWDNGSPESNIPIQTVYDQRGRAVRSILPGGLPGDAAPVTATSYDIADRVNSVTVNAIAGAGTSASDVNLTTTYTYDALGRQTDSSDPTSTPTKVTLDRLGRSTKVTLNYQDGTASGATATDDVASAFGYNTAGEMTGYCPANQVFAGGCDPTSISNAQAWHYWFDALGRSTRTVPPDNTTATDLNSMVSSYEPGGRLTKACVVPTGLWCSSTTNTHTTELTTPDKLGRAKVSTVKNNGATAITTTTGFNDDGTTNSVAVNVAGAPSSNDTLTYDYDGLGRMESITRSGDIASVSYNEDNTIDTRTDGDGGAVGLSTYSYDWAGRLAGVDLPDTFSTSQPSQTWRLDGLIASRSFGTGTAFTFDYDLAKRPILFGNGTLKLEQTYDRDGNVVTEKRTLGTGDDAGSGTQTFGYDVLNRVTSASGLTDPRSWTYDLDGNRKTAVTGTGSTNTDTSTYDRTDQLISVSRNGGGGSNSFTYDAFGNMTANAESVTSVVNYAYDPAERLTSINATGTANDVTFTYDALDRIRTRILAASTDTYSYVGTSEVIARVSNLVSPSTTTNFDTITDPAGTRYGLKAVTAGTQTWFLPDLHGNVAGQLASNATTLAQATRYDAWGEIVDDWQAGGSPSVLPTAFTYQGRYDVSPPGSGTPLLDGNARMYAPALGTFTSLDSYGGTAQNPISMNRYLYASANPTTLIDPTGHVTIGQGQLCSPFADFCGDPSNSSNPNGAAMNTNPAATNTASGSHSCAPNCQASSSTAPPSRTTTIRSSHLRTRSHGLFGTALNWLIFDPLRPPTTSDGSMLGPSAYSPTALRLPRSRRFSTSAALHRSSAHLAT